NSHAQRRSASLQEKRIIKIKRWSTRLLSTQKNARKKNRLGQFSVQRYCRVNFMTAVSTFEVLRYSGVLSRSCKLVTAECQAVLPNGGTVSPKICRFPGTTGGGAFQRGVFVSYPGWEWWVLRLTWIRTRARSNATRAR